MYLLVKNDLPLQWKTHMVQWFRYVIVFYITVLTIAVLCQALHVCDNAGIFSIPS